MDIELIPEDIIATLEGELVVVKSIYCDFLIAVFMFGGTLSCKNCSFIFDICLNCCKDVHVCQSWCKTLYQYFINQPPPWLHYPHTGSVERLKVLYKERRSSALSDGVTEVMQLCMTIEAVLRHSQKGGYNVHVWSASIVLCWVLASLQQYVVHDLLRPKLKMLILCVFSNNKLSECC